MISRADHYYTNNATGDYNVPTFWDPNGVPNDNTHNNNGSNNVVLIQTGDPLWQHGDTLAGDANGSSGAYLQTGSTNNTGGGNWLRMGLSTGAFGSYVLSNGVVNAGGRIQIGEQGTGYLEISGGTINANVNDTGANPGLTAGDGGFNSVAANFPVGTVVLNNGTINIGNGEVWFGNGGNDINSRGTGHFIMHGGTFNANNWFVFGRFGAAGDGFMDGGVINKNNNGNVQIGVGSMNTGSTAGQGYFTQLGGTFNCGSEYQVGTDATITQATNDIGGTAILNVDNWFAVGRNGAFGVLNISGSAAITKTSVNGGNVTIGAGGGGNGPSSIGIVNQNGGTVTNTATQTWIGETGQGTWNMTNGSAILGTVILADTSSGNGTLNLVGGLFSATSISSPNPGASTTLNFYGGTLQAGAGNVNFLSGLSSAVVQAGGAVLDSQGFNITVPQALTDGGGGGGLTKLGSGTLTLSGPNNYTGNTLINAGTLTTTAASIGGGNYTVADSAAFGVTVVSAGAQLNVGNATLASTTGASLDFDLSSFGNPAPTSAPLNVTGTFAVNGTITVNITDALPQVGQMPLVKFVTRSGGGSFVLGSIPVGVVANILTNTGNSSIDLNITSVNLPRWDGRDPAGLGNWDIGVTTNWVNIGTGLPTFYGQGNFVLFDDNALGTNVVNLVTTVNPGSVTVNNNALSYSLVGSGKISGPTHFNKQGTNTFTIANTGGNNYTGPTVISGGVLSVNSLANGGSPSSIGASSASPTNLVLANGALSYSGPPVTINRGFTIASTNSAIDTESNLTVSGQATVVPNPGIGSAFVKTGPAQLTVTTVGTNEFANGYNPGLQVNMGTVFFNGSAGGQTNHTVNEMWVGGTTNTGASLILSNTILNVDSWLGLGRGNGSIGNTSTASFYNSAFSCNGFSAGYNNGHADNYSYQIVTLAGTSTVTNRGGNTSNLGESQGSTLFMTIKDNSAFVTLASGACAMNATSSVVVANSGKFIMTANSFRIGNNSGALASMVVQDKASLTIANSFFDIANGGATGTLLITNNGNVFVSGDFNVTDTGNSTGTMTMWNNALASGNTFLVGKNAGTVGMVDLNGGTAIARGGDTWIGGSGSGTMNQTGGSMIGTNWISIGRNTGGVGIYNLSGGTLMKVLPNGTRLNVAENGTGTLNVSGAGSVIVGLGGFADLDICSGNGNGTVNLNGGTITAGQVTHLGTGTATFDFNGGTLIASSAANANFMNGLTTASVLSGGALIDSGTNIINIGQPLLDGGGGGGLTKLGTGALRLNGVNTYSGTTLVSAGTLGGNGSIAGPVNVAAAGTLSPGMSIGTLTVNNSVTLSGTTLMEISKDGGVTTNDLLAVSGNLAFGGTLTVSLIGTNALAFNDTFHLFTWGTQSGSFAVTNLPAGYFWDTSQLNVNGSIRVTGVTPPRLNPATVAGGKLIETGVGGPPGASYTWLTATNAATPLTNWTTNVTGVFDSTGSFSNAIPINTSEHARFFRLRTP